MREEQTSDRGTPSNSRQKGCAPPHAPAKLWLGEFRTLSEDIPSLSFRESGNPERWRTAIRSSRETSPPTIASVPPVVNISQPSNAGPLFRNPIDNPERTVVNQGAPITELLQVRLARWPRGVATKRNHVTETYDQPHRSNAVFRLTLSPIQVSRETATQAALGT